MESTARRIAGLLTLLAWSLIGAGCAINPVTGTPDLVLIDESEEVALGQGYHQQVLAQYRRYDDAALQDYVDQLGQRIAVHSHRVAVDYRFTVLDSPEVNAFALPGGYIYVTRGILAYLNSEAELAGVLGHEIGHVAARHAVRQHTREQFKDTLDDLIFDHIGLGVGDAFNRLGNAAMRGYDRSHELEADRLGVEYLARAGYNPAAMIGVVDVLQNQERHERRQATLEGRPPNIYHGLFSTHPDNDRRLRTIVEQARGHSASQTRDDNRQTYLRRLQGLVFGPSPAMGQVIGDRYLHGPSRSGLIVPPGWQVDGSGPILALAPPARDAVIQIIHERRQADTDPRQLLLELVGEEALVDEAALQSGALRGWVGSGPGQTPFGETTVRFASWMNDDYAWIFLATAREDGAYSGEIDACIRSFHRLGPAELALTRPLSLDVARAEPGTTFARLAAASPLGAGAEAILRLLNNQPEPTQQPAPGAWIKVVH